MYFIDDDAYVDNEDDIEKHLVNEVGTIWRGTAREPRPLLWEYGQVSRASQFHQLPSTFTIIILSLNGFFVVCPRLLECGTSATARTKCR